MKILKNKTYQALLLRVKSAEIATENSQKTIMELKDSNKRLQSENESLDMKLSGEIKKRESLQKNHENLQEERDRLMKAYLEVVKERDALIPQRNAPDLAPGYADTAAPKPIATKKKIVKKR